MTKHDVDMMRSSLREAEAEAERIMEGVRAALRGEPTPLGFSMSNSLVASDVKRLIADRSSLLDRLASAEKLIKELTAEGCFYDGRCNGPDACAVCRGAAFVGEARR